MIKFFKTVLILALVLGGLGLVWWQVRKHAPSAPSAASKPAAVQVSKPVKRVSALKSDAVADPYKDFYVQSLPDTEPPFERSGAKFDRKIQVNGKTLDLVGTTVRKFEMSSISLITIYTVGFYAPLGEDFSTDIPDVEKALILEYHMEVPKEKVIEAIQENVRANPQVDMKRVEPAFHRLSDAFDSPKKGDRYEFTYIPGRGTAMIKAEEVRTMIPTREFEKAFFGIWLSPHGKDLDMRCELLALPCPPKSMLNPVNALSSGLGNAKEKLGKLKGLIP